MQWKLFADLSEIAGDRTVDADVEAGATVGEALETLLDDHPALADRVLDDDGTLREHINVLRNGEDVDHGDGLETTIEPGDELALFPPVSGGTTR